ncbi:MAG: hypothetical protein ABR529_02175 [Actinomycetota bacterium]
MAQYVWTPEDAGGNDMRASDTFASQEEAEAWVAREWATLLAGGAEHVKLVADGEVVYRMGLREA